MAEYLGHEFVQAKRERAEAVANIGKEYILKEDATLGDMFKNKVVMPKGTRVKVVGYHWAYGYLIKDEKGRKIRTWTIS